MKHPTHCWIFHELDGRCACAGACKLDPEDRAAPHPLPEDDAGLRLTTILKCGAVMLVIYASLAAGMYVLTDYAADTLIAENGHE